MGKVFDSLSSDERRAKVERWLTNLGGGWKGRYVRGLENEIHHLRQKLAAAQPALRVESRWRRMALSLATACEGGDGWCKVCERSLRCTKDCPVRKIREAEKH